MCAPGIRAKQPANVQQLGIDLPAQRALDIVDQCRHGNRVIDRRPRVQQVFAPSPAGPAGGLNGVDQVAACRRAGFRQPEVAVADAIEVDRPVEVVQHAVQDDARQGHVLVALAVGKAIEQPGQ
ncbi:hypothetical protein D3C72_1730250 [compost metagenome]